MRFSTALILPLLALMACRHVGQESNTPNDNDFAGNEENPLPFVPPSYAEGSDEARIASVLQTVAKNKLSRFQKLDVEPAAHKFLEENNLIRKDEEGMMTPMFRSKWGITRIVDHGDVSAVLMNNHILQGDDFVENQQGAWQVLALKQEANGQFVLMPFETGFTLPKSARIAFGNNPPDPRNTGLYYAEVDGENLVNVMKALYTGQPIIGLKAKLEKSPTGKVEFDPTESRGWKLHDVSFRLTRGAGTDTGNVHADELDLDYKAQAHSASYEVNPIGAGAVRKILLGSKWTEVLPQELANRRRPGYEEE